MLVLIGKGCTCSLFVCVVSVSIPFVAFLLPRFLVPPSFPFILFLLFPPLSFPFSLPFPFLFPSVSLPFPFRFHSFSLPFPYLSLSIRLLSRPVPLMTMFNLPCQIAWLPRHHFPVLRGCSHSRGLLLAHSRG